MKIEGARIQDGVLALSGGGREFSLPDGDYRNPNGDSLTISSGRIVEALPPFNPETATRDEMEARFKDLQRQVSKITDEAQLANIDLQHMMQKQQQTVQTLSEVSKTLDDTLMAILRKIG